MSKISLASNASGTGIFTLASPATNTNRTLTLPDSTGTLLDTNGGTITGNLTVSGITTLGNGAILGSPSSVGTMPAFTLGGTVSGGGNNINNVVIGASSPLAGNFTTLTTSSTVTHNGGTASGVAYLNGSKVLTSGSALTFDGTSLFNTAVAGNNQTPFIIIRNSTSGTAAGSAMYLGNDASFFNGIITKFSSAHTSKPSYFEINNTDNAPLTFIVNSTEVGRFSSTGLAVTGTVSSLTSSAVQPILSVQSTGADSYPSIRIINDARTWQMYVDGTTADKFKIFDVTANEPRLIIDSSGTVSGGTSGTGFSFSGSAPATSLTLTSGGDVGIGTTTIGTKLVVAGTGQSLFGTAYNVADFTNAGQTLGTRIGYDSSNGAVIASSGVDKPIAFWQYNNSSSNYVERMRIDSSGNLLVGATSNLSSAKLDVRGIIRTGSGNSTNDAELVFSNYASATSAWNISVRQDTGGANNDLKFLRFNSSGAFQGVAMQIDSASGNLGIGTTNPSTYGKLAVNSTAAGGANVAITKENSGTANQNGQVLYFNNSHAAATGRNANVVAGQIIWQFSQPTSGALQYAGEIAVLSDSQGGASSASSLNLYSSGGLGLTINSAGNTVIAGTISAAMAGSTGGFTSTASGSAASPSIQVYGGGEMGFYRITANQLGIAAGGVLAATVTSTGLAVTGTLSATIAADANSFSFTQNSVDLSSTSNPHYTVSSSSSTLYTYLGFTAGTATSQIYQFAQSYAAGDAGSLKLVNNTYGIILDASHASTGVVRLRTAGSDRAVLSSTGLAVTGTLQATGGLLTVNTSSSGTIAAVMQCISGSVTAAASTVAKKIVFVNHTNSLRLNILAVAPGGESAGCATFSGVTNQAYGGGVGVTTTASGVLSGGAITAITVDYNNGGSPAYTIDVTLTYTGSAPTIYWNIEGVSTANIYNV